MPDAATALQQTFLSRITDAAVADARICCCWTEGTTQAACFPPFAGAVDLHIATTDPLFDVLAADPAAFLAAGGRVLAHREAEAPVRACACEAELEGGLKVTLTVERMSLLPKRPRAFIAPLVDKTQQLRYVLDYSRRG